MPTTDAQRALLRAALLRDDGLLPRPDRLAGAALLRIMTALSDAGFAEAVPVNPGQPRWQEIEGVSTGLRITEAGRAAAGAQPALMVQSVTADDALPAGDEKATARGPATEASTTPATVPQHRPGSKAAQLVAMLSEIEGASIDAIVAALGWQPHTVRAALTRLRQRGTSVLTSRATGQSATYRIAPAQDPATPADSGTVS